MKPSYLIDTDWIIDHFHKVEKVVRKLEELASEGLALSIVSLAELYEGFITQPILLEMKRLLRNS
jgi:tRNA(fMet)-specific endonuclease VapC